VSFFFIDDTPGVSTITYVGMAESGSANITIPATAQTGDIAALYDLAISGSLPALVTPSGWANRVNTTSGVAVRLAVSTKILESGDAGASITGMDGSSLDTKMMLVFRPNILIGTATYSTFTGEATTGDASSQSIAASGQSAPVLVIAGCGTNSGPVFSTASPAFDAEVTATVNLRMGYKIYNAGSTPASHTIDMASLGSRNSLWGGYIALT
jgi:hypothetical protein